VNPDSISGYELDQLLALGWYRMHQYLFTSSHIGLEEPHRVHWLRYAIHEIRSHTSHRRIMNRNKYFRVSIEDVTTLRSDHAELHRRYRAAIDFDGALSIEECLFGGEQTSSIFNTKCISVFDGNTLIAGGYFDVGATAAASILHFFDPAYNKYSPGKYLILITIDYLKGNGYHFYYPGYVVEGVSKMDYKLFLGREQAQYFDPMSITWKYFEESILGHSPSGRDQISN
jgi:arginine-tRNA-protein transferase